MTRERSLTLAFLALANLALLRLIRPSRGQIKSAAATALGAAAADFGVERSMGRLGVWEYDLPRSVSGLPVDLFLDFFLWVMAYCTGYSRLERRARTAGWKVAYVSVVSLLLGTWAYRKNSRVAAQGRMRFAEFADVGTPLFVAGNYLLIAATVVSITAAYSFFRRRVWPDWDAPDGARPVSMM